MLQVEQFAEAMRNGAVDPATGRFYLPGPAIQ
jgi:hypothetical protein